MGLSTFLKYFLNVSGFEPEFLIKLFLIKNKCEYFPQLKVCLMLVTVGKAVVVSDGRFIRNYFRNTLIETIL